MTSQSEDQEARLVLAEQGTLPRTDLAWLLDEMQAGGWRAALDRHPLLRRKRHWFTDERKGAFYTSLPAERRVAALEVGAGSGVISAAVARHFDRVVALDHSHGWCAFMRGRFAQDGIANVAVVRGDALRTPLPRGAFDLVIVNGVLEWVPVGDASRRPRDVQIAFLEEVRDVLRPGGVVGIAIENRFHFRNFLGASPHGEPPWVALLPRGLADRVMRRRRGRPYRTWIYGPRGYRRLLEAAGFRRTEIAQALPTYHQPEAVAPLQDGATALRFCESRRAFRMLVFRALAAGGLLGRMGHSFYIAAWR